MLPVQSVHVACDIETFYGGAVQLMCELGWECHRFQTQPVADRAGEDVGHNKLG